MWQNHEQHIISNYKNGEILNIRHHFYIGSLCIYNVQIISKIKNNINLDIWYPIITNCHSIDDKNLDYLLKSINYKNKNMIRMPIDNNYKKFIFHTRALGKLVMIIHISDEQQNSINRQIKKNIIMYYDKKTKSNIMEKNIYKLIFKDINKDTPKLVGVHYIDSKLITFPIRKIYGNIEYINYKLENYGYILGGAFILDCIIIMLFGIFFTSKSIGTNIVNLGCNIINIGLLYKIRNYHSVSNLKILNSIIVGINCIGLNFFEKNYFLSTLFSESTIIFLCFFLSTIDSSPIKYREIFDNNFSMD